MVRHGPSRATLLIVGTLLLSAPVETQQPAVKDSSGRRGEKSAAPRMPDGRPDLQGVWNFATVTPMERPRDLADKPFLTEAEAADYEAQAQLRNNRDTNVPAGNVGDYNNFWYERGRKVIGTRRTSLVIDPPDGRIPPLTPDGVRRRNGRATNGGQLAAERQAPAGYEDLPLIERCYLGFNSGPPMTPSAYNNNMQMFQTRDHVVILTEMIHEARVVPIDGRPHGSIRQWLGDSRGRWEGDTLVVDTINFLAETNLNPKGRGIPPDASKTMHLVERFTRVAADTLLYQFTMDDPSTWTRPWTAEVPMSRIEDQHIYEYACHEGNYALPGILGGARMAEKQGKEMDGNRGQVKEEGDK
jgi:hypothetical protein